MQFHLRIPHHQPIKNQPVNLFATLHPSQIADPVSQVRPNHKHNIPRRPFPRTATTHPYPSSHDHQHCHPERSEPRLSASTFTPERALPFAPFARRGTLFSLHTTIKKLSPERGGGPAFLYFYFLYFFIPCFFTSFFKSKSSPAPLLFPLQ